MIFYPNQMFRGMALFLCLATCGCSSIMWRAQFIKPEAYRQIDAEVPFLKCHTPGGDVFVLANWKFIQDKKVLVGNGFHYDVDRNFVAMGILEVPFSDIALIETNQPESVTTKGHFIVMGVLTGVSLVASVLCLSNPKACFGSCPTFYANDGTKLALQAEGFSSSVARVLEKTDIDAMFTVRPKSRRFELLMTNDALETHMVRSVSVLAIPRPVGGRVFSSAGRFYPATAINSPLTCSSELGDCLELVSRVDDQEYISPADEHNLATREQIELSFPHVDGPLGLAIAGRNSLLNTFLFYQTLAYMGMSAGDWFMKLERGGPKAIGMLGEIDRLLGNIDVSLLTKDGTWQAAGSFAETGPIAREVQLVRLPGDLPAGPVRIRLKLTKGNWKLDYLAIARLGPPREPIALPVTKVEKKKAEDTAALASLLGPDSYLMTYPGDAYNLFFDLPDGDYELFLQSRGFYYEWIRKQWLAEENHDEVARILLEPAEAFKRLAPAYKKIEPSMEEVFWKSRFGR
ncbi:MAG TPA: hypothetical protein VM425_12040 [Myxococcota bacterium]|nr:hypothetical protein [Myxococcota bacterium]